MRLDYTAVVAFLLALLLAVVLYEPVFWLRVSGMQAAQFNQRISNLENAVSQLIKPTPKVEQ